LLKVNYTGFHDNYHYNKIGDCSKAFTNTQSLVTRFDLPMITCHEYSVSQISKLQLMFNCCKLNSIGLAFKPDGTQTQFNGETQFILCNLVTKKNISENAFTFTYIIKFIESTIFNHNTHHAPSTTHPLNQ